jgi:hypothetical protein
VENNGVITFDPGTAFQSLEGGEMTTIGVPYIVTDVQNASSSSFFNVEVTGVNDVPEATDDSVQVLINGSILISVLGNDMDVDDGIDVTTVNVTSAPGVAGATAVPNASGQILYTPATNFSGMDTFKYTVDDNTGAPSAAATVTVNVVDMVVATCAPFGNRVAVDVPLSIDTSSRFTGPINSYGVQGLPGSGSLSIATGTGIISGTPVNADLAGSPYSVVVTADDGGSGQTLAFQLTIDADNDVVFYSGYEDSCVLP